MFFEPLWLSLFRIIGLLTQKCNCKCTAYYLHYQFLGESKDCTNFMRRQHVYKCQFPSIWFSYYAIDSFFPQAFLKAVNKFEKLIF